MLASVIRVHGPSHPWLREFGPLFAHLCDGLEPHLEHDENSILIPRLRTTSARASSCAPGEERSLLALALGLSACGDNGDEPAKPAGHAPTEQPESAFRIGNRVYFASMTSSLSPEDTTKLDEIVKVAESAIAASRPAEPDHPLVTAGGSAQRTGRTAVEPGADARPSDPIARTCTRSAAAGTRTSRSRVLAVVRRAIRRVPCSTSTR